MVLSKVISWNCNGLRSNVASSISKLEFFDKEYPNGNFAVAIFLESHHRDENDFPDLLKEFQVTHNLLHTPTPPEHPHRGIIVLVSKQFDILSSTEQIPGRLLNFRIKEKGEDNEFNISAFYGPVQKDIARADAEGLIQNFFTLHSRD